jgi:hypothetical protein
MASSKVYTLTGEELRIKELPTRVGGKTMADSLELPQPNWDSTRADNNRAQIVFFMKILLSSGNGLFLPRLF